eukprot:374532-Prymnesium_polylepis.1
MARCSTGLSLSNGRPRMPVQSAAAGATRQQASSARRVLLLTADMAAVASFDVAVRTHATTLATLEVESPTKDETSRAMYVRSCRNSNSYSCTPKA